MDLQTDFLDSDRGRMPVDPAGADAVLRAANAVLDGRALATALPILVLNRFPTDAHLANRLRRGATVEGTSGAQLDARLGNPGAALVVGKTRPSAFSNPELNRLLLEFCVLELTVLGVFAQACVRATVSDAVKRGYRVQVIANAVASDAAWKKRFALWSMRRAGATIVPDLPPA
jgi:nicotinamidase-related amidase